MRVPVLYFTVPVVVCLGRDRSVRARVCVCVCVHSLNRVLTGVGQGKGQAARAVGVELLRPVLQLRVVEAVKLGAAVEHLGELLGLLPDVVH